MLRQLGVLLARAWMLYGAVALLIPALVLAHLVILLALTNNKEYRDTPDLNWRLPANATAHLNPPPGLAAGKAAVVETLFHDRTNIQVCALILALYRIQWQALAPESNILNRPDIQATLFQIGFERSNPKSSPRSNAFGRKVLQTYDSSWLRQAFP